MTHSGYYERICDHAEAASDARAAFDPPARPPAEAEAMEFLRFGLGPLVTLYIEARTAGWDVRFSAEELELFHRATNDWLTLYAACYGVEFETDFTVREAAEILIRTHNIRDTAELLTHVPAR
ncbi:MAG: hypothetical protein ACQETI_10805 [Halobacteriota archaeon]